MSSLESAIRILRTLSSQKPTLRVSEAAAALDMPKSTVSRLLKTLSDGGLLERQDNGRDYSVGPLLLQLGGLYVSTRSVLDLVDRVLARLIESYGYTGYAGMLAGSDVVILRQWQGSHPLRLVLDVGARFPAVQTALGLCLLAACDDDYISATLGQPGEDAAGSGVGLASSAIMADIARCRRLGWIEVPCATAPGISAIGALIHTGDPTQSGISLSISFPDHAVDREMRERMTQDLLAAVAEISELANLPLRLRGPRVTGLAGVPGH